MKMSGAGLFTRRPAGLAEKRLSRRWAGSRRCRSQSASLRTCVTHRPVSGYLGLLVSRGVSLQRLKTFRASTDPDFEAKKNRVVELL
jgi:hypothetical protein